MRGFAKVCALLGVFGLVSADVESSETSLTADDECSGETCALNALQLRAGSVEGNISTDLALSQEGGNASWASCAAYGCHGYSRYRPCQCNSKCKYYHNCCGDYWNRCYRHPSPPPPSPPPQSKASCAAIPSCAHLRLHGDCCPTPHGDYLGCCPDSMVPHPTAPPPKIEHGRQILTVYHQTSPEICKLILANGFKLGHSGWCGGAIYFAMSPQATKTKAITPHSGVGCMIEAKVDVGRQKKFPCCRFCGGRQDQQIGWTDDSLARAGADSIEIDPGDGPEIVIYNKNRVVSMRTIPFNPAWTP
ncbi:unnamed protein product, partial [Symbiodinium sp. CCMP2456]